MSTVAAILPLMPTLFHGLVKCQILAHQGNLQQSSNTFYISNPSASAAPDFTELTQLATDLDTFFSATYKTILGATATLDSIVTRSVADPTDPGVPIEATRVVSLAGTRSLTGGQAPQPLCGLINLATPNASRRFRGHMFLPPLLTQASLAGDVLNTSDAYYTAATAIRDKFRAGYVASRTWTGSSLSNYNLVVYSHKAASLSLPSVANVSFVGVRNKVSFLRSRQRGTT